LPSKMKKMANLLSIETSTSVCSVNFSVDGQSVFNKIHEGEVSHASLLGVFVADAVKYAEKAGIKTDAVAVSAGPGSYTGLRIGLSEAKGLCYGWNVPLIAVPTLKILAVAALSAYDIQNGLLCPMLDARRMEVYSALYDLQLNEIRKPKAEVIDTKSYQQDLAQQPIVFFGTGAEKCQTVIRSPQAQFLPDIYPTAETMIGLANQAYAAQDFVNTAYFEPYYLKEFQATVPKKMI